MWKGTIYISLLGLVATAAAIDNFTMSVNPPPVPGSDFTITWNPSSTGEIVILLNAFDPSNPSLDIITSTDTLVAISNTGSWVWHVPSGLCGRYSFSIAADFRNRYNYGEIWSIPCPSTSATVIQTTACSSSLPSPTGANSFLSPNTDDYPVRVGKVFRILWNPTTSGTVSIQAYSSSSTKTTIIAGKISNSGSFDWTPSSDLQSSSSTSTNGAQYTLQIVDDTTQKITSNSPSINLLIPSYETVFINVNDWMYPVVGNPLTIQWSPSNATTIAFQVTFGMIPDSTNSIYIAQNAPNNGSFTWNVPLNFTPGRYTVIAATPGNLFDDLQVIIVGTSAASPCGRTASIPHPPSTAQATISTTSFSTDTTAAVLVSSASSSSPTPIPALQSLNYVQILQTTCSTSIVPVYTSFVSSGTTTSFPIVGCPASTSATSTASSLIGCPSGYSTFSIASSSSVCCPSAWQTSSLDLMYCFTSAYASPPASVTARAVHDSIVAPTVIVISDVVFVRAGTVKSGSSSSYQSPSVAFRALVTIVGLLICL